MINLCVTVILLLLPAERDSLLSEIPANSYTWLEAFENYSGDTLTCIEHLFVLIPMEDRNNMTASVLEDHVISALNSRNNWYNYLDDSTFLNYLLPYRIADEPLSSYRSALGAWLSRRIQPKENVQAMAEEINNVIKNAIVLSETSGDTVSFSPTQILPTGRASRKGRWILLGAALRTMGIPAKPVMGWFPGVDQNLYLWIDVWTGQEWYTLPNGIPPLHYVKAAIEYPSMRNITAQYRDTGTLLTNPLSDFNEGGWSVELLLPSGEDTTTISNLFIDPFQTSFVTLGAGQFILRVQFSSGYEVIGTWLEDIVIEADSTTSIDLTEAAYSITPLPR